MTSAAANLLYRLIAADRRYRTLEATGEFVTLEERGIEVGRFNGVDPRTANALEALGLVELLASENGLRLHAYLGAFAPLGPMYDPQGAHA